MDAVGSAAEINENLARLEEQLGSDALHALLRETVSYLRTVREGLERSRKTGDRAAVAHQLHQLKGSLVIFGSAELKRLLVVASESEDNSELFDAIDDKLAEALSILQARIAGVKPRY